mgnify:CR=1 FL=1
MAFYESIFILKSSVSEEEASVVQDKMKETLEKHGASIIKAENWGKKKLAYEIAKQQQANYTFMQFEAAPSTLTALDRACRLDESVIRHLIVKIDSLPSTDEEEGADDESPEEAETDEIDSDEGDDEGPEEEAEEDEA